MTRWLGSLGSLAALHRTRCTRVSRVERWPGAGWLAAGETMQRETAQATGERATEPTRLGRPAAKRPGSWPSPLALAHRLLLLRCAVRHQGQAAAALVVRARHFYPSTPQKPARPRGAFDRLVAHARTQTRRFTASSLITAARPSRIARSPVLRSRKRPELHQPPPQA